MENPLVTLFVFAYKQEQFVCEAIQGALDQTYSPLEIILSDDCSPDGTFEIMEEMARNYKGPHRLVLNRNATNLGLCGHVNRLMELAQGELLMPAAGDDISMPDRVATTVGVWQSCSRPPFLFFDVDLFSSVPWEPKPFSYNPQAMTAESMLRLDNASILAPAMAWHRSIFERFGPLPASAPTEDKSIAFRAALLGPILYASKPLVRYRIHGENITYKSKERSGSKDERKRKAALDKLERFANRLDAFEADLRTAREKSLIPTSREASLLTALEIGRSRVALRKRVQSGGLLSRYFATLRYLKAEQRSDRGGPAGPAHAIKLALKRRLPF